MPFSEDAIEELRTEFGTIRVKYEALMQAYIMRTYNDARAKEFAVHGFSRGLKTLNRCIENVFEIYLPDRVQLLSMDELTDVAINIQAFVVNVFGCVDNLAWIWVLEKGIAQANGEPLLKRQIGLRQNNQLVRNSLPREFHEYLCGLDEWFNNLEDFRHAVAHRIPLYVPPFEIVEGNIKAYNELERQTTAAIRQHNFDEYQRLMDQQKALGRNSIVMRHSFEENRRGIVFHAQMQADFNTIDELGHMMLQELGR